MRRAYLGGALIGSAMGLILTATQVQAQFPLDIVAGPTFATVSTDEFDTSNKTGFFAGVGTMFQLSETVGISPYIAFVQKGASFGEDDGEDTYSYIEIPVFLSTAFPLSETVGLGVSVGPQIAFNMSCTESVPNEDDFDCKDYNDYKGGTEFGLVAAAGLQFPLGGSSFGVGAGFDLGLTDVFEEIEGGYKNRVIYIFGSYGLTLGGM